MSKKPTLATTFTRYEVRAFLAIAEALRHLPRWARRTVVADSRALAWERIVAKFEQLEA